MTWLSKMMQILLTYVFHLFLLLYIRILAKTRPSKTLCINILYLQYFEIFSISSINLFRWLPCCVVRYNFILGNNTDMSSPSSLQVLLQKGFNDQVRRFTLSSSRVFNRRGSTNALISLRADARHQLLQALMLSPYRDFVSNLIVHSFCSIPSLM